MAYDQGEDREINLLPTARVEQVKTFRGFEGVRFVLGTAPVMSRSPKSEWYDGQRRI